MRATRDQQRRQPRHPRRRKERRRQGGFALLVVFLMAAAVAYSLYRQLPRAAFESVRDKEQLLIDRGGQYKRAIEVYFAVNKRYPATLDDLEKGDKRYLRRRYKDPLNGKDEWRLIHTNGTMLTDSLVQKPGTQNAGLGGSGLPGGGPLGANSMNSSDQQGGLGFGGGAPGGPVGMAGSPAGGNPAGSNNVAGANVASAGLAAAGFGNAPLPFGGGAAGQPAMNAAALRRPSDRIEMTTPFRQNQDNGGDDSSGNVQNPFDPNNLPPITLTPPPNAQQGNLQPGQPGQDPNQPAGGQPFMLGQPALGQPPLGAPPIPGLNGMPDQQPGQPDSPFPGQQPLGQDGNVNSQPLFPPTPNTAQANVLRQFAGQGGLNPQPVFIPPPGANPGNPNRLIPGGQSPVSVGPGGQFVPSANQNPQQTFAPNGRGGGLNAGLPPGAPNQAEILINNQLRTPGPTGGLNQNANPLGGNNLGSPGIAGVASTFEGPSIKTYAKREKYQEWEFVFDPAAARTGQQGIPGQAGQAGPLGQNPQQPNQNSPFGQQPAGAGFGSTNPFSPPPSPNQQQGGGIGFPAAPGGGVRR